MQYSLGAIEIILKEHEDTLEKLRDLDIIMRHLELQKRSWIPGLAEDLEQELAKLEEVLGIIRADLEKHMRFEEDEFLPTLIKYASDIVSRGVLFEHKGIIESITNLREHARAIVGKPASPALDRTVERGPTSKTHAHLRSSWLWQDDAGQRMDARHGWGDSAHSRCLAVAG